MHKRAFRRVSMLHQLRFNKIKLARDVGAIATAGCGEGRSKGRAKKKNKKNGRRCPIFRRDAI